MAFLRRHFELKSQHKLRYKIIRIHRIPNLDLSIIMIYNLYYKFFNNCLQNNKNVGSFHYKYHLILTQDLIISTCMLHNCALSHMEYNIILWKTLSWINNCRWKIIENSQAFWFCRVREFQVVFRVSLNIFISNIVAISSIKSFHSLTANCRWCVDIVQMKLRFWRACVNMCVCVCIYIFNIWKFQFLFSKMSLSYQKGVYYTYYSAHYAYLKCVLKSWFKSCILTTIDKHTQHCRLEFITDSGKC